MEDKKQDVNSLEELVKTADSFREFFSNLANELAKILPDIEIPEEKEDSWEMKCPYKVGDEYWFIFDNGHIDIDCWEGHATDFDRFKTGNAYPTEETAELEAKRRNLLTLFRAFRDECNGNWKVNWNKRDDKYYLYLANNCKEIVVTSISTCEAFPIFGYFKNRKDLERAIELFEDEIIELYVDNEV